MTKPITVWDKLSRDKDGKVVIWQTPNVALSVWLGSVLLSKCIRTGQASTLFRGIASGAILVWALQEVISGSSLFRRLLGLVVLGFSISGLVAKV